MRLADTLAMLGYNGAPLGVAVSGGGDSMALLHMIARSGLPDVHVATVDHGLRDGVAAEIQLVADMCGQFGLSHDVLKIAPIGPGNIQSLARSSRYHALTQWAQDRGVKSIALGHTQDDQAETFLLALARGSGVDGLAAMARADHRDGITWLRPMLDKTRADLRSHNTQHGVKWAEDPSNDDQTFDRIKLRQAQRILADLGLTPRVLAVTAGRMGRAKSVLQDQARALAARCVSRDMGDVLIDLDKFQTAQDETKLRLLRQLVQWVGSSQYPPRYGDLTRFAAFDRRRTLNGVVAHPKGRIVRLFREPAQVAGLCTRGDQVWDQRFQFEAAPADLEIRSLGEVGVHTLGRDKAQDRPFLSLCASPSLWRGSDIIAAPYAGLKGDFPLHLVTDPFESRVSR